MRRDLQGGLLLSGMVLLYRYDHMRGHASQVAWNGS